MSANLLSTVEEEAIIGVFDGSRIDPATLETVQQLYRRLIARREIRQQINAQSAEQRKRP